MNADNLIFSKAALEAFQARHTGQPRQGNDTQAEQSPQAEESLS
jgi:hypothetical protein